MKITIGTCGACGGPVTIPTIWHGVTPPTPQCDRCGATPANPHGPVIEMQRPWPKKQKTTLGYLNRMGRF